MIIKKSIESLKPGFTYYVQVKNIDSGQWSESYEIDIPKDTTSPPAPTSLNLNFDGPSLIVKWDGAASKSVNDFLDFEVVIGENPETIPVKTRTFYTAAETLEFPFDENVKTFGVARYNLTVSVRARDTSKNLSNAITGSSENLAPQSAPIGNFAVNGVVQGYSFDLSGLTGKPDDYASTKIYVHTASTGGTEITNFNTTGDTALWRTANYLNRYVSVAYTDSFGRTGPATTRKEVRALNPVMIDETQPIVGGGTLLAGQSASVSSYSISSNVITFTCSNSHGFSNGDNVIITGILATSDGTSIDGVYNGITVINATTFSASKTASNITVSNIPRATATRSTGRRTLITKDGISGYIDNSNLSFQLVNISGGINKIGGWQFDDTSIKNLLPSDNNRNIELNSSFVSLFTTVESAPNFFSSGITGACTTNCPVIWAGATSALGDAQSVFSNRSNAPFLVRNDGSLQSTKGTIAGWSFDATKLTSGSGTSTVGLSSNATPTPPATDTVAIWAGKSDADKDTAPFRVTHKGNLFASNATISGTITSSSGTIGGWEIGENKLYGKTADARTFNATFGENPDDSAQLFWNASYYDIWPWQNYQEMQITSSPAPIIYTGEELTFNYTPPGGSASSYIYEVIGKVLDNSGIPVPNKYFVLLKSNQLNFAIGSVNNISVSANFHGLSSQEDSTIVLGASGSSLTDGSFTIDGSGLSIADARISGNTYNKYNSNFRSVFVNGEIFGIAPEKSPTSRNAPGAAVFAVTQNQGGSESRLDLFADGLQRVARYQERLSNIVRLYFVIDPSNPGQAKYHNFKVGDSIDITRVQTTTNNIFSNVTTTATVNAADNYSISLLGFGGADVPQQNTFLLISSAQSGAPNKSVLTLSNRVPNDSIYMDNLNINMTNFNGDALNMTAQGISSNGVTLIENGAFKSYACLLNKASQSIPNNTNTFMFFDNEVSDPHEWHSQTTNTQRITPNRPGYYHVKGFYIFSVNATGVRIVAIRKNGVELVKDWEAAQGLFEVYINISTYVYLNGTTDYVDTAVLQTSGGALNCSCDFTAVWIGNQ